MRGGRALTIVLALVTATSACGRPRWKSSRRSGTRPLPASPLPPALRPTIAPGPPATPPAPGTAPTAAAPTFGPPAPPSPCVERFGRELTTEFGRLDGYLSAVVPPRARRCKSDERHLHLQLEVHGESYDIALPLGDPASGDVAIKETSRPLPSGPWIEGWHPSVTLDYVGAFRVRSTDFEVLPSSDLLARLEGSLTPRRRVSVWATGYAPGGAHEVHRDHGQHDGAIALDPDAPTARILLFRFARQRF